MMNKIKEMLKKQKGSLKNKKGGLSQLLSVVLLLIITVFIFISAIHPNGKAVRAVGDDAQTNVVAEQGNIQSDFQPTIK